MYKTFYEIFEEVDKQKTKKEKIAKLREHSSASLKLVLGATYDPRVKWLLPEGTPPYKALGENADVELGLAQELRRLYLFMDGPTDAQKNLTPVRREQLFIGMLEGIDPRDAKVLIGMKDRKLPFKSVTKKLVAEAFPNLTKDW